MWEAEAGMTIVFAKKIRLRLVVKKGFLVQLGFSCLKGSEWKELNLKQERVIAWAKIILEDDKIILTPIPCANGLIFQFDPEEIRMKDVDIGTIDKLNFWIKEDTGYRETTYEDEREYAQGVNKIIKRPKGRFFIIFTGLKNRSNMHLVF